MNPLYAAAQMDENDGFEPIHSTSFVDESTLNSPNFEPSETYLVDKLDEMKSTTPEVVEYENEFMMSPDTQYYVDKKKDGAKPKLRPNIMHLIDGGTYPNPPQLNADEEDVIKYMEGYNFGWIEGVFIRCTLSIFGVLMFLRLNWMFAQAGVGGAIGVIIWSVSVTLLTTMSLSALSTNGVVKGGGVYYMVSRALGAEFGGVVGATLFIAQSMAVALNLNGFGEAVVILENGNYVFDADGDKIFYGIIGLFACLGCAFLGANFEVQSQKVLAVSMVLALFTFFIGTFISKNNSELDSTPISPSTFEANLQGEYSQGETWLTVFGVFFPACTGISAGSSISGDLKDPQEAIPKGTFAAIGLTTAVYLAMGLLMCAVFTPEGLRNITTQICAIDISLVPPLMYLGMFAAALSTALALIVGAPRVLQALARDDILPLDFYKKSYFAQEEPLRGYITVVVIAFICIVGLDLNTVSPIVTNFYLVQYGLMNYSVYHAHISKAPGWRPSYKYWSPWLALLGAMMCFISMFMVNWILAICTMICSYGIFQYIAFIKPNVNWGDSGVAACQKQAVEAIYRMERLKDHVKNYRPQFLLLCEKPKDHTDMIWFMSRLKKSRGIALIGSVVLGDIHDRETLLYCDVARRDVVLANNEIVALKQVICAKSFLAGAEALLQLCGVGKLKPNTIMLGFKNSWQSASPESNHEYIEVIRACFQFGHAVCIIRHSDVALNYVQSPVCILTNNGNDSELFAPPLPQGHIDVYWMVEDGGHTFLLAYLLNRHAEYRKSGTRLRLMGLIASKATVDERKQEIERLQVLLKRFRFDADVILIQRDAIPADELLQQYEELSGEKDGREPDTLSNTILSVTQEMKTHSWNAHVVVVSLPSPKVNIPDRQYFAYLEMLSATGRPTLFVRGNQQTVLSYHS